MSTELEVSVENPNKPYLFFSYSKKFYKNTFHNKLVGREAKTLFKYFDFYPVESVFDPIRCDFAKGNDFHIIENIGDDQIRIVLSSQKDLKYSSACMYTMSSKDLQYGRTIKGFSSANFEHVIPMKLIIPKYELETPNNLSFLLGREFHARFIMTGQAAGQLRGLGIPKMLYPEKAIISSYGTLCYVNAADKCAYTVTFESLYNIKPKPFANEVSWLSRDHFYSNNLYVVGEKGLEIGKIEMFEFVCKNFKAPINWKMRLLKFDFSTCDPPLTGIDLDSFQCTHLNHFEQGTVIVLQSPPILPEHQEYKYTMFKTEKPQSAHQLKQKQISTSKSKSVPSDCDTIKPRKLLILFSSDSFQKSSQSYSPVKICNYLTLPQLQSELFHPRTSIIQCNAELMANRLILITLCEDYYFHCGYYLPKYRKGGWNITNKNIVEEECLSMFLRGFVKINDEEYIFFGNEIIRLYRFELLVV